MLEFIDFSVKCITTINTGTASTATTSNTATFSFCSVPCFKAGQSICKPIVLDCMCGWPMHHHHFHPRGLGMLSFMQAVLAIY